MTRLPVVRCDFLARRCKRRVGAPEMRRPGSRVKRGHSFGLHKHDRCSCFDLRRNCCFVCRYNGTDRAGLDPKALLARKPERPVLHRCQCGAARECWNCNRSRVANRNGAWLFQIVHMKLAVSARGVAGVERVLQVVKVHVRTRALLSLAPKPDALRRTTPECQDSQRVPH